ncbi:MAG: acetamidase/formamidase family protein [Myxococcales bacterium]|nr:acetamidase/formamidase family protein [Myxococcales bacterium]MCB9641505.1 acetamidase/formamidase family protein [Myxococcales bacterium]
MKTHILQPGPQSLHGYYAPDLTPALTVQLGDRIEVKTLDIAWGMGQHDRINKTRLKYTPRPEGHEQGPALCGPIAIEGISAGETLAVHIESIQTATWGWSWGGGEGYLNKPWNQALGVTEEEVLLLWELDPTTQTGISEEGHRIKMRPFLGMLGLSPGGPGQHNAWHPSRVGGNTDCRRLIEGTTLHLPVEAPLGMLSLGDGHAYQSDGELGGTAIECPMERVVLRVERSTRQVQGPFAETPEGWAALGFGETLEVASHQAINLMLDQLCIDLPISRARALTLASIYVDLHITQVANGVLGVHTFLSNEHKQSLFAPYL